MGKQRKQSTSEPASQSANQYSHQSKRGARSRVLPDVCIARLAAVTGVNRSYLSRMINGHKVRASYVTLERLRVGLGMVDVESVDRWLKGLASKG